jgi:hypothetical protein
VKAGRMKRLEKLLKRDAKNKKGVSFDMQIWGKVKGKHNRKPKPELSCNTFACALGLAAISGEFTKEGLGYNTQYIGHNHWAIDPTFKGEVSFEVGASFFGLSFDQASWLFSPQSYSAIEGKEAELEAASRVRYLIKHPDFHPFHT